MKNQELAERTKNSLINTARVQFTEKGYAETSLEEIVGKINITRGALYHHFGNKLGLFKAVVEVVQRGIAESIEQESAKSENSWEQLVLGCHAFVHAALLIENRRILLVDGPAVLGWNEWSEIDEHHSESRLLQKITDLKADGLIKDSISVKALTTVISGSLNEAVLWVSHAENPEQAKDEVLAVIDVMLNGFRK
ncbi:AcrR family transcriptional regulator [Planomicrobium stackebrandtii]|uniref:AcrR family transcriptional regulator n=1 Tax=Planomicrobium stackebrandtii TaxID=253160 RepID=A0ABU0GTA0_9BACL|nr:TetR/AcrR family transcriptional regulator [Planomicrobium stackebrandtii]MDQ0428584.1 AcrR family transcriptional regulator [Planomicrobium stackebrandtii]